MWITDQRFLVIWRSYTQSVLTDDETLVNDDPQTVSWSEYCGKYHRVVCDGETLRHYVCRLVLFAILVKVEILRWLLKENEYNSNNLLWSGAMTAINGQSNDQWNLYSHALNTSRRLPIIPKWIDKSLITFAYFFQR